MSKTLFSPSVPLLRPSIAGGHYPERPQTSSSWLEKMLHAFSGIIKTAEAPGKQFCRTITAINQHGTHLEKLDEAALSQKTQDIRVQLHRQGLTDDLTRQSFALVREMAHRTLQMRHFDTQLLGGWIMVHGGLAEMETGEGKTLTATLAAATAALAGIPVHIVTVNDYLVTRDAQLMGPLYQSMGLSVGTVTTDMDTAARRAAYACDITYCTNKQLAFDYLRDRMLLGDDHQRLRLQLEPLHDANARSKRLFLRGLCFAIIDEADSVLTDEARTPLIISGKGDKREEEQTYLQAMDIAKTLENETDFSLDPGERRIQLNEKGRERLASAAQQRGGIWRSTRHREELISQALSASHLYLRDRHYLVRDDKVVIIDDNTGRLMTDRAWEHGLQQMIEIKEQCSITGRREPLARLTYQRFFRRYLRLAGMTGTAREVRRELWSIYRLPVFKIETNRPSQRSNEGQRIYTDKQKKWAAVVQRIRKVHQQGRPLLVGTRSVADSEYLSTLLHDAGLSHQLLNARQDALEAKIIAGAGSKGAITIATNMAGRGTDIPLAGDIAAIGGLHIIATERNEAKRIDRQLFGRCGRQGDPGSYESILSLDDELLHNHLSKPIRHILVRLLKKDSIAGQQLGLLAMHLAQTALENRHLRIRRDLLQINEQLDKLLAFSGQME